MTPCFTSLRNIRTSLKLKTMTLHVVIAGCGEHGPYARGIRKTASRRPFTGLNATYGAQYWKRRTKKKMRTSAAGGIQRRKRLCCAGWTDAQQSRFQAYGKPTQRRRQLAPAAVLCALPSDVVPEAGEHQLAEPQNDTSGASIQRPVIMQNERSSSSMWPTDQQHAATPAGWMRWQRRKTVGDPRQTPRGWAVGCHPQASEANGREPTGLSVLPGAARDSNAR